MIMATLLIDDDFRRVVRRMRLAQIEEPDIASALGFSEAVLIKYFGSLEDFKREVENIKAADEADIARMDHEGSIYTEGK
jgi:hypothetical protein